ncbi:hypothetical protein SAMN05428959_106233 [Duganella sp. CF517]|uniref:hypothetical protein n=1 Tax=Duganella sp. CF517 TaxID=1881038 RepID=UPI0008B91591|nr:hypothetical protein [Duganella sp. CF517]SEO30946.1 hypothetical protein SAMN05428959_106233 [Duganella sp. CF517]
MYLLTFLLILLSYPMMFLIITVYIFGPLTMYLGYRAYSGALKQHPRAGVGRRLWAARALLAAAASFAFQVYLITTQFKA